MLGKMDSVCELVAGARYEALQMDLGPLKRFIVGRSELRSAA